MMRRKLSSITLIEPIGIIHTFSGSCDCCIISWETVSMGQTGRKTRAGTVASSVKRGESRAGRLEKSILTIKWAYHFIEAYSIPCHQRIRKRTVTRRIGPQPYITKYWKHSHSLSSKSDGPCHTSSCEKKSCTAKFGNGRLMRSLPKSLTGQD